MTNIALAALLGYFLGSIPFGWLLARAGGLGDIRRIGSGSIGATNVLRSGKKSLAALTLLLDLGKGALATFLAMRWGKDPALIAAAAAVIGHSFPVWLGFRGGKGVATALGVLLVLVPKLALVALLLWLATAFLFHYSSLAALVAAFGSALISPLFAEGKTALLVVLIALFIILRHHGNIRRLLAGEEDRISFGKS